MLLASAAMVLLSGCATERPADITLDELEKKMAQAMDPAREYRRAGSYFQRQNIEEETFWGNKKYQLVDVKFQRPDKFKFSYYEKNQPITEILSVGGRAWLINHKKHLVTELDGKTMEKFKVMLALSHPDTDYDKLFRKVDMTLTTLSDDREYYKLVCHPFIKESQPIIIYVDKAESLPKRLHLTVKTPDGVVKSVSTIEEYQKFGSIKAAALTRVDEEIREYTTRVVGYQLNAPFSEDEFKIPEFDPVLIEMERQKKRRR